MEELIRKDGKMHMKKMKNHQKIAALLTAFLFMIAWMSVSVAAPADWLNLSITLTRYGSDGQIELYQAYPVTDTPGSFWAYVPTGISLSDLIFNADYPGHESMIFFPAETIRFPRTENRRIGI